MAQLIPHIHFEKQEPGSMLCAQHALNALLQGPYYEATQLSDIAQSLDDLERQQLDAQAFADRDVQSLNMDDTGFFSVSVIENALQVWALTLVRWRSEEMRPYQNAPEFQLGFLLNLNSHWFAFRSFGRNPDYWYNLNSFLPQPSWVGRNYLGALLDSAETEGYSVFVVMTKCSNGPGTPPIFKSSTADEIASTLDAPSSSGASASALSLGLKPSAADPLFAELGEEYGATSDEDDAELQAALRASMAEAGINSEIDPVSTSRPVTAAERALEESRIRNEALLAQTQREQEGAYHGALAGEGYAVDYGYGLGVLPPRGIEASSDITRSARRPRSADLDDASSSDVEETDADIDNLAPSRTRQRLSRTANSGTDIAAEGSSSRTPALPSASGARRRGKHATDADPAGDSNPAGGSSLAGERGTTPLHPIEVGDSSSDVEDHPIERQPRSPFLAAVHDEAVDVDALDDDDDDDDDDITEIERAQARLVSIEGGIRDRRYDDEDAELQAALAASLGDPTAVQAWHDTNGVSGISSRPDTDTPEWLARFANEKSPPPADVDRIARMREEARRKHREDAEARARGEDPERVRERERKKAEAQALQQDGSDNEDEEEEEEAEQPEQLTAAQIREQRLKRFAGA